MTDECSRAGIVRARDAAEVTGIHLVVGAEFRLDDGLRLVLLVEDRTGYSQLCRLITVARRAAEKGEYRLGRADVEREAFDNDATGLFRSEEHTSELQSLMRNSYAVLRLKKKQQRKKQSIQHTT